MTADQPQTTTLRHLCAHHEGFLLDSFGVLLSSAGAIDGAREMIEHFHRQDIPYLVLTNDASRHASTKAAWYKKLHIPIPEEKILTSGALLQGWFARKQLMGRACVVLGPQDSHDYVKAAGGHIVAPGDDSAEVIVACDDAGYPFLEAVEAVLSQIFRAIDQGRSLHLVLPNPDLIYPKGEGEYGLTSGSVALLLEDAIALRYPDLSLRFERLGKPHAPIFEAAIERLGTRNLVMIGDQLRTDVLGAQKMGLASALVDTGLTRWGHHTDASPVRPTWLLPSLRPDATGPQGPTVARQLWISGRVQGVAFRAHTLRQAQQLQVRGWVKNLPDGRVQAHIEGAAPDVDALQAWCQRGPRLARVQEVLAQEATPQGLADFQRHN